VANDGDEKAQGSEDVTASSELLGEFQTVPKFSLPTF